MSMHDDESEKTSIVASDTFKGRVRAADDAPPAIVILIGPTGYVGRQFALNQEEVIIGRSPECAIFIDDRSVSRNHAKFITHGQDVQVEDMASSNKTVVNGQTLEPNKPIKLKNNDQIKAGNVICKFLEKGSIELITNRELNEKAQKDALTGIYSKGALIEKGPEAIKRSDVLKEELSVVVFDLDFFKKINDGFGHACGDYVLKDLARLIMNRVVRSQDFFARYGGEEFVIILHASNIKSAFEVAERLRTTIEQHEFIFENKKVPVTISAGVSQRKAGEDWANLFARADEALYHSKQSGRNKVTEK